MKHIVFRELSPNPEIIYVRSSELNGHMNPSPYDFPNIDSRSECLEVGDRIHDVVQYTMLMGEEKGMETFLRHKEELLSHDNYERVKEIEWFVRYGEQYVHLAKEHRCDYIEAKRQTLIDFSGYQVVFSGQTDAEIGRNTIIDIKSAGSKRTQEKADSERQKYYYSWIKNIKRGTEDTIEFKYHIYTKQKKAQFQEFVYSITFEEAQKRVMQDLKLFLTCKTLEKTDI